MTTAAEWLARTTCTQGHALYGPGDLYEHATGEVECRVCRDERLALNAIRYGTARELRTERQRVKVEFSRRWG